MNEIERIVALKEEITALRVELAAAVETERERCWKIARDFSTATGDCIASTIKYGNAGITSFNAGYEAGGNAERERICKLLEESNVRIGADFANAIRGAPSTSLPKVSPVVLEKDK